MGDDIKFHHEFYRSEEGGFSSTPITTRITALDGEPSHREPGSISLEVLLRGGDHEVRSEESVWPRAFNRTLLFGDVSGDGHIDIVSAPTPDGVDITFGSGAFELLATPHQSIPLPVPSDGAFNRLVDLNGDGKLDIVLHHPIEGRIPFHPEARSQTPRVTVLLSH